VDGEENAHGFPLLVARLSTILFIISQPLRSD
jgi:hypothetical protein